MSLSIVRVLIVDDNAEARENIRRLLSFEERIEVVGEASNGVQALDQAEKLKPDVVLMDVNLPLMDGFEATERITRKLATTYVVMISVQNENDYLRRAMMAGAKEYLIKPFSGDQLIQVVLDVYDAMNMKQAALYANHLLEKGYVSKPKVITLFSGKGGVGKTALAVNGAISLVKRRKKVLIMDLDLLFGDVCLQLNLRPKKTVYDALEEVERFTVNELRAFVITHPSGVDVLSAPLRLEQAEFVTGEIVEKMIILFRECYDFIIVDTAPVMDEAILSAFDQSDELYLVNTPHVSVVHHNQKVLKVLKALEWDDERIKLLVNRVNLDSGMTARDIHRAFGRESTILFIEEKRMDLATNNGRPLYLAQPSSPWVKKVDRWADVMLSEEERKSERALSRSSKRKRGWLWLKQWV